MYSLYPYIGIKKPVSLSLSIVLGTNPYQWFSRLTHSNVLYVGNLPRNVTEEDIILLFSKCGIVIRVVLGFNRQKENAQCGFGFIQFSSHAEASFAMTCLNGTKFKGNIIRCDWDSGEGILIDRKFGRATDGNQRRDCRNNPEQ